MNLGIDTSNYTTSAALVSGSGEIIKDLRTMLKVKQGEKGLRQSDALFQHWQNLPCLLEEILCEYNKEILSVTVSTRPRPQDGSYMPVFTAGMNAAKIISDSLSVPLFYSSHQEGHLAAASHKTTLDFSKPFIFAHLSGGTLEIVEVKDGDFSLAGRTLDISYGQLLDRAGVFLGYPFPSGKYLDALACSINGRLKGNPFKKFVITDGINLSGAEFQFKALSEKYPKDELVWYLFERIAQSLKELLYSARDRSGADQILLAGGVSSSSFLREYLKSEDYIFPDPHLASDNAVGAALIGGKAPWL